jgi:hypothetical protein
VFAQVGLSLKSVRLDFSCHHCDKFNCKVKLRIKSEDVMDDAFGLRVAHLLNRSSDAEWPEHFERLRRDRQLSTAIRQINALLDDQTNREVAVGALRRIGLWDAGQPERG